MSKVTVIGHFTSKEDKTEEVESVLAEMVDAARGEPGVEIYSYHRGDDHTYWFFAVMADHEAMRDHGRSDAMQAAMAAFGPLVESAPQMNVCRPLPAVGLDV
jgi:quinol monooxygenase YgiN